MSTYVKAVCILVVGAMFVPAWFRGDTAKALLVASENQTLPSIAVPTGQAAAVAETLPRRAGECMQTSVKAVGTRLEDTPGSGSLIEFTDGEMQVSYETIPGIDRSRPGDPIKLCLIEIPRGCPPGDDRGRVYTSTNLRSGDSWTEGNSSHMCGGA